MSILSIFGDLAIYDTLNIPINNGSVTLKRVSNENVLLIINRRGISYSKLINLKIDKQVSLRPLPPCAGSLKVDCLYLKLDNELILKPNDNIRLNINLPLDLGIYIDSILIETIPLSNVKYALYGPPDLGDICRLIDLRQEKNLSNVVKAELEIIFESRAEGTIGISKIIAPLNGLSVFRDENSRLKLQTIEVVVYSSTRVEVTTKTTIPRGFNIFSFNKPGEYVYVMRYGT